MPGSAPGQLERALQPLAERALRGSETGRLVLAAASAIAAADGELDAAERDAVARLNVLLGAPESSAALEQRLNGAVALAHTERIASEMEVLGAALQAAGIAREGLLAAAVIGLVSQGLSLGELSLLRRLGRAASIEEAPLAALIEQADLALG